MSYLKLSGREERFGICGLCKTLEEPKRVSMNDGMRELSSSTCVCESVKVTIKRAFSLIKEKRES